MTISSSRTSKIIGSAALITVLAACSSADVEAEHGSHSHGEGEGGTSMLIPNATIVAGEPGTGRAAFLGTIVNTSDTDDEVTSIIADGRSAVVDPLPFDIDPGSPVRVQTGQDVSASFSDFTARTGTYVPVSVHLKHEGELAMDVLVVPPSGFYAKAAPPDADPETTDSGKPTPMPTAASTTEEEHEDTPHGH